jgi:hypothetical protein
LLVSSALPRAISFAQFPLRSFLCAAAICAAAHWLACATFGAALAVFVTADRALAGEAGVIALRRIALIYPQSHPAMCWPRMKPFYSVARRQLTQVLRAKSALRRSTIFENKGSTNDETLGHIETDADRAFEGVI